MKELYGDRVEGRDGLTNGRKQDEMEGKYQLKTWRGNKMEEGLRLGVG